MIGVSLLGIALLGLSVVGVVAGRVPFRAWEFHRSEQPRRFWLVVGLYAVLGSLGLAVVLWAWFTSGAG